MKMVIDLPDSGITEDVLRSGWESDSVFDRCIKNACKNAVILPEGHGRLIDADAYRKDMLNSREFDFFKRLDMQPTIIEADVKGGTE